MHILLKLLLTDISLIVAMFLIKYCEYEYEDAPDWLVFITMILLALFIPLWFAVIWSW